VPDCVKVLDFGLVREYRAVNREQDRLSDKDAIEGTPWFMPPEAFKNSANVDPRSDIYSVGALGYYLLTGGQYAFPGESLREIHRQQLAGKPAPPSQRTDNPIGKELEQVILSCLEIDPALRPQSVGILRSELQSSPVAAQWNLAARAQWWAMYHRLPSAKPAAVDVSTLMATVRIDIADRIEPAD
jgi:serine/threonine-protein kinase